MDAVLDVLEYLVLAGIIGVALVLAGAGWFLWSVSRSRSAK